MSAIARNFGSSRLLWTACIVAGASLPHWGRIEPWILVLLASCIGWRLAAGRWHWPLPKGWMMALITFAALGAVLLRYGTINGLEAGTALLIVMMALKFLEAKTRRDHIMLTVIAYFLVFAALLAGSSPLAGVYLLAFAWLTTLGLLQVGRIGPLRPSGPTARLAGKLLLEAVPIMIVVFVLFPRLSGPLWSWPGRNQSATTGLSSSMSPGDITSLGLSDDIAFRAEFMGQEPAPSELYWRGPVLSNFNGRRWTRSRWDRGDVTGTIDYLGEVSRYRVMLEPGSRSWAFALEMPQRWQADDPGESVAMRSDYQLQILPPDSPGRLGYTVTSYSRYRAVEPLTPKQQEAFTELPPGFNPRTRKLVDGFLEDDPDPATIIARGLDVFRADGFFYTLTPPALGRDTADDFIFNTREGFCEHYASAFAIMMRMAGLPARVVTGYQGGERNGIGDYYIIRQSNAHAWTEVWTPDEGWQRVDPIAAVAPERIALGSSRTSLGQPQSIVRRIGRWSLLRQAGLAWDAVNTAWNEWVVGYGPRLQRSLLQWLGMGRLDWRELLVVTMLAAVLMMAAITAYYGFRMRNWQAPDPAARSFTRFARKLAKLDVAPRQAGETASDYAERAARDLPGAADAIRAIVASYLAARYEPDTTGSARERLHALVSEFRPRDARASR